MSSFYGFCCLLFKMYPVFVNWGFVISGLLCFSWTKAIFMLLRSLSWIIYITPLLHWINCVCRHYTGNSNGYYCLYLKAPWIAWADGLSRNSESFKLLTWVKFRCFLHTRAKYCTRSGEDCQVSKNWSFACTFGIFQLKLCLIVSASVSFS